MRHSFVCFKFVLCEHIHNDCEYIQELSGSPGVVHNVHKDVGVK